jgi:hypothetical protein
MSTPEPRVPRFAVCLKNDGYSASLEPRKLSPLIDDRTAWAAGHVRVIDESGDDYLYPAEYFIEIPVPHAVREALLRAS